MTTNFNFRYFILTRLFFGPGELGNLHDHSMPGMFSADPYERSLDDCLAIYRAAYR